VVVRVIRPKFVPKDRSQHGPTPVRIAAPAELPIDRGLAGPGLLADTIVRRWQDHQPLHRLEGIYARDGVALARSTICGWHAELAALARPLVEAMRADALEQPYLCTDATGVLVQAKEKCRTGHFWVLVAPALHVLFGYSPRHDSAGVDKLLAGYRGYLVADAHAVYDHLYADGQITEVGCWAHQRRYLFQTLASEPERAREGLAMIGALFQIERTIATAPRPQREAVGRRSPGPSSTDSSRGAMGWWTTRSTTRRSPRPSATRATSATRSGAFSMTAGCRCTTTRANCSCGAR
jgi:hypothetical protein